MFRLSTVFLFSLAAAGIVACDGNDATGPEVPADQVDQPASVEAEIPGDQSAAEAPAASLAITATRLPKSFFINSINGSDANPGTKLKPFKTLARGLSTAIPGDSMRLASGVYSAATGEKFTNSSQQVAVPAGVTILGTLAEDFTSRLHGVAGETGLKLKGGATVRNLVLSGFSRAIDATQGVQLLKNLVLDQNSIGLSLIGSARATLVGSRVFLSSSLTIPVGANVEQQAQFTMSGGTISGGGQNCKTSAIGVRLDGAARLTMKNGATLKDIAGPALTMVGTSKALLTGLTTIDRDFSQLGEPCSPNPSVLMNASASLTLRKARVFSKGASNSVGIQYNDGTLLTLDSAVVSGHTGAGIRSLSKLNLAASGSTISGNFVGIDASQASTASITITRSSLSGNVFGIGAPFFKLRSSKVTGNAIGIVLTAAQADLGKIAEPGNNTISGNFQTGVQFGEKPISGGFGTISAAGNTWNTSTQGSDGSGHYLGNPLFNGTSPNATGKNFELPLGNSNFKIQL